MRSKKITSLILSFLLCSAMLFSGCNLHVIEDPQESKSSSSPTHSSAAASSDKSSSTQQENSDQITPAVWKVSDADGNYIYMMGSIHAADDAIQNMPEYFESAFSKCDSLAVEADTTLSTSSLGASLDMFNQLSYSDDTKIYDHIPKETYDKMVEILKENNLYNPVYDSCTTAMWESMMEQVVITKSGLSALKGVDMTLINRAKKEKKNVLEVESMDFQLNLMKSFSDELYTMALSQYTEDGAIDQQVEALNELYDKWKKGTLDAKSVGVEVDEKTLEVSLTEEMKKLQEDYNNQMLVERNKGMADKAEEYMQSDSVVFFLVGAAHFYGDDGVLQLMKDRGCTVTQLSESDAESTDTEETNQKAA